MLFIGYSPQVQDKNSTNARDGINELQESLQFNYIHAESHIQPNVETNTSPNLPVFTPQSFNPTNTLTFSSGLRGSTETLQARGIKVVIGRGQGSATRLNTSSPWQAFKGLDVSNYYISFDYSEGMSRSVAGTLVISQVVGLPSDGSWIAVGSRVDVEMAYQNHPNNLAGMTKTAPLRFSCYVTSPPQTSVGTDGLITFSIPLGGQITMSSVLGLERDYYGRPPDDTGLSMSILSQAMAIDLMNTPANPSTIYETLDTQSFRGMQAVSDMAAVNDYEVWEVGTSGINMAQRNRGEQKVFDVNPEDYVSFQLTGQRQPLPKLYTASNTYNLVAEDGYYTKTSIEYSDNYNVANTKPWFAGGSTIVTTTTLYRGANIYKVIIVTQGYRPTATTVAQAVFNGEECVLVSPVPTVFGTLTTEIVENRYAPIYTDHEILVSTYKNTSGYSFKQDGNNYRIYSGQIAEELTLMFNDVLKDVLANRRHPSQAIWNVTNIKRYRLGILGNGGYGMQEWDEESFYHAANYAGSLESYAETPPVWYRDYRKYVWNELNGTVVEIPLTTTESNPPSSTITQPLRIPYTVSATITNDAVPPPRYLTSQFQTDGTPTTY
jgi:hypothetical protein